jgi:hypothetical protein
MITDHETGSSDGCNRCTYGLVEPSALVLSASVPSLQEGTAPPGGRRRESVADSSFSFPPSHAFLDLYVLRVIQHINVVGAEASAEVENESQHRSEPRYSKF